MTVATQYSNYPVTDKQVIVIDKENKCSPNLIVLRNHLLAVHGGQSLGCYVERPIRGGTTRSIHWYGGALDWRYENPGPGREVLRTSILPWLIDNSMELGIQSIHDYVGARIWHAGRGWRSSSSANMGDDWAQWIHVEVHPDNWYDARPIDEKLPAAPPPPPPVPTPTPTPQPPIGNYVVNAVRSTVKAGDVGKMVWRAQFACQLVTGSPAVLDGTFGFSTAEAIFNLQRFFGLTVDGVVGPATWAILETVTND